MKFSLKHLLQMLNHGQKANNTIHSSVGYIEGQILKKRCQSKQHPYTLFQNGDILS